MVGSEAMAVMGTGCSQVGPHVPYVESYRFWRKWPKKTIRPQFWSVGDYKISTPGLTGVIYWSSAQHGRFPTFLARLLYLREPDIFGVFVTSFYAFLKNCFIFDRARCRCTLCTEWRDNFSLEHFCTI